MRLPKRLRGEWTESGMFLLQHASTLPPITHIFNLSWICGQLQLSTHQLINSLKSPLILHNLHKRLEAKGYPDFIILEQYGEKVAIVIEREDFTVDVVLR